jgi:uncharacterized membrane protein YdjX (TVP38/TMEM64 family)
MAPAVVPGSRLLWRAGLALMAAMAVRAAPVVPVAMPVWPEAWVVRLARRGPAVMVVMLVLVATVVMVPTVMR